jgi:hypothetical protein
MFSAWGVALNGTTASVQLRVLHNSVYLSARLKLRGTNSTSSYSETSINRFSGSIVQFLWSLNKSYLNYGNKTHINHSSIYRFPASVGQNF